MSTSNGRQSVFSVGFTRVSEALRALDKDAIATPVETLSAPARCRHHPRGHRPGAMTVEIADEPVMTVAPQRWMANPLGAIQGGVIASLIGQACSLAGQAHTAPGDRYTLADLSVYYFRSPPVDGRLFTLATTTERVGRRMGTVATTMADVAGTSYVRAVANIAYERATAF